MMVNKIISKTLILYLSIYLILFMAFYCLMPFNFSAYFSILNTSIGFIVFIISIFMLYININSKNITDISCDKTYFICTVFPTFLFVFNIIFSLFIIILFKEKSAIIVSLLNVFASTIFYIFSDFYYNTILNYSEKNLRTHSISILNKKVIYISFYTKLILKLLPLLILPMLLVLCFIFNFDIASIIFIISIVLIVIMSIFYIILQIRNGINNESYNNCFYDLQFKINTTKQIYNNDIYKLKKLNNNERLASIETLRRTVDAKDAYTRGHSDRVSCYSVLIGEKLGLSKEDLEILKVGGLFHDIGKIGIPDNILLKPSKLTFEEYDEIKKHPLIGAHILENSKVFENIIPIVLHHHERYDGKGYPYGLKGEDIPFMARIVAVSDTFDAMTSSRSYRNSLSIDIVKDEFKKCNGTQFDPDIVSIFLDILENEFEKIEYIQNENRA